MYNDYRQTDFFWGALVGGAVATLTTLLFTTKKGKEVQEHIENAYHDVEEAIKNKMEASKEKVEEGAGYVHKKVAEAFKPNEDRSRSKQEETSKASK